MEKGFESYVDHVLNLLKGKKSMFFTDCRNNLYQHFSTEFQLPENANTTLRHIITFGFIESFNSTNSKGGFHENLAITEKGLTLLSEGGFSKWKHEIDSKERKEAEKLDYDLWLAKQSKKWFWVGIITGIIGGILGIISFILNLIN